jgi:hypothetical protein
MPAFVQFSCCVASLGGVLLVAGCATPVHSNYKSGTDFAQYRTFSLLPLPQTASASDPGLMLRLSQTARDEVTRALTAKGLSEAPAETADLAVNLRGQSLPRVEVRDYGYTYPTVTRYGTVPVVYNPSTSVSTYDEKTLIIELLDHRSKELVWVGWMKKDFYGPVKTEDLQEAIREILAKYPPVEGSSK